MAKLLGGLLCFGERLLGLFLKDLYLALNHFKFFLGDVENFSLDAGFAV